MLELEEALARILAAVPHPTSDTVSLSQARGRVLKEAVASPIDLPPFDNSAMDGYAVVAADVASAAADSPARLHLAGKTAAGEVFRGHLTRGQCVRVFTGSALPEGTDAVVMQEDTRVESDNDILVLEPAKPWENIRLRGEDVKRGAVLAEVGEALNIGRLSLLAAAGLAEVHVGRQPVVGVVATGSELREPGQALDTGQIYESNRLALAELTRMAGGIPTVFPLVADDLARTRDALRSAFEACDVVVTSGGASVGELDFIKQAFAEAGGDLQFWRVAMKPGRPFVFGRFNGKLLFGLPGNPVSALVTFVMLVRPALLRWQGMSGVALLRHPATLAEALANPGSRRHFVRVKVDDNGRAFSAGLQASHALSSLGAANGLVDLAPGAVLSAGETVAVLRWD